MGRPTITIDEAQTDDEHRLEQLEAVIARGLAAYRERNDLIARMVHAGTPKVAVARRINLVRERLGVEPVTADAVAKAAQRYKAPA